MIKSTSLAALLIAIIAISSLISCDLPPEEIIEDKREQPDEADETDEITSTGPTGGSVEPIKESCSTKDDWEKITNIDDLKEIDSGTASMGKNYCLTADIDLAGETSGFPIGWKSSYNVSPFTGNFDGDGHSISNLNINQGDEKYIGLFAKIQVATTASSSSIKNFTLDGFSVKGERYVGALAGEVLKMVIISDVIINNAMVEATTNRDSYAGGVVGRFAGGKLIDSAMIGGEVNSNGSRVGGLIGHADKITISNSYATSNVSAIAYNVGGLVGSVYDVGIVSNSYATGEVKGHTQAGGLIGSTRDTTKIINSYAEGSVSGTLYVGGLIGYIDDSILMGNHAKGNVNGVNKVGGLVGHVDGSIISSSQSNSIVVGTNQVGGLVGNIYAGGKVLNSYANGVVSGASKVGGLVGYIDTSGEVLNSYARGKVSATRSVIGGLIGELGSCTAIDHCHVTSSYFDVSVNGGANAIGLNRVDSKVIGTFGVAGSADIALDADGNFHLKSDSNAKIFNNWEDNVWEMAVEKWPIFKPQSTK